MNPTTEQAEALRTAIQRLRNSIAWMEGKARVGPCIGLADMRVLLAALASPAVPKDLGAAIHYPGCWDTAAYPTLVSALNELTAWFRCSNQDTHPAQPSKEAQELRAWRERFPQHIYRPQDDCVALRSLATHPDQSSKGGIPSAEGE